MQVGDMDVLRGRGLQAPRFVVNSSCIHRWCHHAHQMDAVAAELLKAATIGAMLHWEIPQFSGLLKHRMLLNWEIFWATQLLSQSFVRLPQHTVCPKGCPPQNNLIAPASALLCEGRPPEGMTAMYKHAQGVAAPSTYLYKK